MPSILHEALLELFRNRPTLAPELLRDALQFELPTFTEARIDSADLTEVVPAEYRADLVVRLLASQPVFAIVVEVQLARDDRKRKTWPVYVTGLGARTGCPTALLVVTPDEGVALWASQPIKTGHPGFDLRPLVLGPSAVPLVTDPAEIVRDPELAVLSAMAHGGDPLVVEIARVLNTAVPGLDGERARLYLDLVVHSLRDAARKAFEALMQTNYEYQSDYARKYFGQGREKGIEEGIEKGRREALLSVLAERGIELTDSERARIDNCEDPGQLTMWLKQAVTANAAAELFRAAQPAAKTRLATRRK